MTNHTPVSEPSQEMGLLDLLVVVSENIKLLLIGPLIAGLLAFIGLTTFPPALLSNSPHVATFEINGQRLLSSQQLASLVSAAPTLEQAAKLLESAGQAHLTQYLKPDNIKISSAKDNVLVSVSVFAAHETEALAMANALLKATLAATQPQGAMLMLSTQSHEIDQSLLSNARELEKKLFNDMLKRSVLDQVLVESYNNSVKTVAEIAERIEKRQLVLNGLTELDVVTRPRVLPMKATPIQSKTIQFSFLSMLAMAFVLFLFVFIRQTLRQASSNPETADKLARIRLALGLRKTVI